jgi:hypothetical protein
VACDRIAAAWRVARCESRGDIAGFCRPRRQLGNRADTAALPGAMIAAAPAAIKIMLLTVAGFPNTAVMTSSSVRNHFPRRS